MPCRYKPAVSDIFRPEAMHSINNSLVLPWQLYDFTVGLATLDASFFAATAQLAQDASLLQLAAQALGAGQWRYSLRQRYVRARQEQEAAEGPGAADARARQLFRKRATIESRRQQQEADVAAGRLAALLSESASGGSSSSSSSSSDSSSSSSSSSSSGYSGSASGRSAHAVSDVLPGAGAEARVGGHGGMLGQQHGMSQAAGSADDGVGDGSHGGTAVGKMYSGYSQPEQSMLGSSCGWVGLEVSSRGGNS